MTNWQKDTNDFDRIKKGSPSSYWSTGLQKRFDLVLSHIKDFKGKKILDVGCGVGTFLQKFSQVGMEAFGVELDKQKVDCILDKELYSKIRISPAENLPFEDNTFDFVFSHEVLEHVDNDQKAVTEALRVLKPNGQFIIFCPNIRWFFETHGIYIGKKYIFGNIPLVTYLPRFLYNKLTPHVRNYSNRDIKKLFKNQNVNFEIHRHVFPGFDGLIRKLGVLGKIVRRILDTLENTFLHYFGISHFVIVEKV
jgi:SAM-dependent methyltransferase